MRRRNDNRNEKRSVLFVCMGNASRSQMAEGYVNARLGDRYQAVSAGLSPTRLCRKATQVMKEIGINISDHRSKGVEEFYGKDFDIVITLSEEVEDEMPFFIKGKDYIHRDFADPNKVKGDEVHVLDAYRALRDRMIAWLDEVLD